MALPTSLPLQKNSWLAGIPENQTSSPPGWPHQTWPHLASQAWPSCILWSVDRDGREAATLAGPEGRTQAWLRSKGRREREDSHPLTDRQVSGLLLVQWHPSWRGDGAARALQKHTHTCLGEEHASSLEGISSHFMVPQRTMAT